MRFDSVTCSVQTSTSPLNLSSLLISHGLVQYRAQPNDKTELSAVADKIHMEKRVRKKSDEAMLKNSSELLTIEDFQQFFDANRIDILVKTDDNIENETDPDVDNRTFEVFDSPSKHCPLTENGIAKMPIYFDAHPLVDRITEHFKLLNVTELVFHCRAVHIMDPVTVLIDLLNTRPPSIGRAAVKSKYFPLQGLKTMHL